MKRALICGISGQDGAYLAQLLLEKGYEVAGASRDAQANAFANLERLGVKQRVRLLTMGDNVRQVIEETRPDEVYNLAGQSSVAMSFQDPLEAWRSNAVAAFKLLEAIRGMRRPARLYNACTAECFGDTGEGAASEETPFRPCNPYAQAKAAAYAAVVGSRKAYKLWACSGILCNHESPLRPSRFVTRKVADAARSIAAGSGERLRLGTLSIVRDWGWAPEYVEAIWRLLQQDAPRDYVIATGKPCSLEELVGAMFAAFDLDWKRYVDLDPALARPSDPRRICGNPERAARELGWSAQCTWPELARRLVRTSA